MIIDGRTIANHILDDLSERTYMLWQKYHTVPHLAVIRVGSDEATSSYIAQKEKMAKKIGAVVSVYNFDDTVQEDELIESMKFLQEKGDIHGLILQLPIPKNLNEEKLIKTILPQHDIDGFVPNSPFMVPIASAVYKILGIAHLKEETSMLLDTWLSQQKITVLGKGKTGGQPIIDMLKKKGIAVQVIDSQTKNPEEITREADIIITAVGKLHLLTSNMIKKDVILLGIGMDMDEEGNFYGDYNEEDIKDKAKMYTPIPGGVGPVNVACLLENLVSAAEQSVKN